MNSVNLEALSLFKRFDKRNSECMPNKKDSKGITLTSSQIKRKAMQAVEYSPHQSRKGKKRKTHWSKALYVKPPPETGE